MRARVLLAVLALGVSACETRSPDVSRAEADTSSAIARCEAVPLNIVVANYEDLEVNGAPSDLEGLRLAAQTKAEACEGVTPRARYEGPKHVTVISSMIWPILREELPDLELESCMRGPGGRGLTCDNE